MALNVITNDQLLEDDSVSERDGNCFEFITYSGKIVRCRTDLLLPDGTRFNDSINKDLFDSVKRVLELEEERKESKISLPSIYGSLYLLTHWMYLKGIYRFEQITDSHLEQFKNDSVRGLDVLINATPRVYETLINIQIDVLKPDKQILQILNLSGIPDRYITKLPKTRDLIKAFLNGEKIESKKELRSPQEFLVSKSHMRTRLDHIKLLWSYRSKLKSSLRIEPFSEGVWLTCKSIGKEEGTTKTIPVELIPNLVGGAINWLENYAPMLIAIHQGKQARISPDTLALIAKFNQEHSESLTRVLVPKTRDMHTELSIRKAKRLTYVACLVVIHIFTARRSAEVSGLDAQSLVGEFNNRYLLFDIGKTQLRDEPIPCPEIVAKAFKIILEMRGLDLNHQGRLWETNASGNHSNEDSLDIFAEIIGAITYTSDGIQQRWHYAVHQFRRIFAILYVWRFEGPFAAIQHHLRHISWKQTFIYVRDKKIYNDVLSESISLTTNKLRSITSGETQKPAGVQSVILIKHIERMKKSVDVADENCINKMIQTYIEERGLILRATPWGYCGAKSNKSNLKRAACQSEANVARTIDHIFNAPDGSGSSEELCAGCHFHYSDETKEDHWRQELQNIIRMEGLIESDSETGKRIKARKTQIQRFVTKYYD